MSKELDEILKPYECTSEHACKHKEQLTETKDKFTALLSQIENEARIDEVEDMAAYAYLHGAENVAHHIRYRIATLQGDKK